MKNKKGIMIKIGKRGDNDGFISEINLRFCKKTEDGRRETETMTDVGCRMTDIGFVSQIICTIFFYMK
jgi:hypothetical protein